MVIKNVREDEGRALLEMLEHLRQGAKASTDVNVRILAAADHDGVCAAKILSRMLHDHGVKFVIAPVRENSDIHDEFQKLEEDSEVKSVVLLNCGASLDLKQCLIDCQASDDVRCFVIDAHRPLLLANLSQNNEKVIVLDDDPISEARGERPPVAEYDAESESDGEEDDSEKENEWRPDGTAAATSAGTKRSREERREDRIKHKRQRINEYYYASYFAMPSAMSVFKMARQAAPPSQDFLWLAAVCLMGYFDQGLMSESQYNRLAWEELKEALDSSNDFLLSNTMRASPTALDSSAPFGGTDDEGAASERRPRMQASAPARRRLRFESDLRITLYKHWSLEESIMHSAYFYGTMELHRDKGLRALKNFFATAGLPPSEYKQVFRHMNAPIKRKIRDAFTDHGKGYGLTETRMFLQQFMQDLGALGESALIHHEISCADVVHIISAMLCAMAPGLSSARPDKLPKTSDGQLDMLEVQRLEKEAMVNNFYQAYDAVLCEDAGALREGILEAVEICKSVQSMARQIRDTKSMKATKLFRWCKIDQPPLLFRSPMAVRKLAMWMLHTLYTFTPKGESEAKPLLVIVRDLIKDTYLCVGTTPARFSDQDEFGSHFRAVMRTDRSLKFHYDYLDKSCIEVAADDIDRFLELLHEVSE